MVEDHTENLERDPDRLKFKVHVGDKWDEILSYQQIMDHIAADSDNEQVVWQFEEIVGHQNVDRNHPNYMGSSVNVLVKWTEGSQTYEPLKVIGEDSPVACAVYARENNLLNEPGWKHFKHIAKRQKTLYRQVNQAKLRSFRTAPKYKYGFEVARDYAHAMKLDAESGTTRWKDATKLELAQIDDYETFEDIGKGGTPPIGFRKIKVHLVFDVKHDGRHKAHLVAAGHLTETPLESVYSGVVSLRGL
jgi:hypothetical protein